MDIDEKELLNALKGKLSREAAFKRLMLHTQERLYTLLHRMLQNHDDVDDALQNTYLNAWRAIDSFRGDSALYSWLYRIASNEALSIIAQRKRTKAPLEIVSPTSTAHHQHMDGEEIQRRLENAIRELPPKQQLVFKLRYFDEMPYEQMAEITQRSIGALKASYFHAVKRVEQSLQRTY